MEKQVHTDSDLDMYAITKHKLKKRPVEFVDKLHEGRTKDNMWGKIGIYVDCVGNLTLSDPKGIRKSFFGRGGLIGNYYVIVTPFSEVEQKVREILTKK